MGRLSDLDALADWALQREQDPRRVWPQSSLGFESRIERSRGMIRGGGLPPHPLTMSHSDDLQDRLLLLDDLLRRWSRRTRPSAHSY